MGYTSKSARFKKFVKILYEEVVNEDYCVDNDYDMKYMMMFMKLMINLLKN